MSPPVPFSCADAATPHSYAFLGGDSRQSACSLLARLGADQAQRWQSGERPLVEDYLRQYPILRDDGQALLELIDNELRLRRQQGERPLLDEYCGRFPTCAAALRHCFVLHSAAPVHLLLPTLPSPAPALSTAPSPLAAQTVPGYEVLGELGRGGMGVVYKARQVKLNRLVALKMILAGEHAGPQQRARFRAEAETVGRLQHPNIVQIYEVGEHHGLPYFSLELCPGGSLAETLDGTPWPPRAAAGLVATLAQAMQAAHAVGIVHRDLKPANVLLAADGTPKVSDFGLAKRLDQGGQTRSGTVLGTPSYMAPEQAGGPSKAISAATDVFALGAILYRLLTGRPPFQAASLGDTVLQVLHDEPLPVRRLQPRVCRSLETICRKCLEKEPQCRYSSAQALAEDLQRWLANRPIQARHIGVGERLLQWARRRPALAALAAVSAAALMGLIVLLSVLWRNAKERAHYVHELEASKHQVRRWQDRLHVLKSDMEEQQALLFQERAAAEQLEQSVRREKARAQEAQREARRNLLSRDLQLAQTALEREQIARLGVLLEHHLPRAGEPDVRGFEWHHLWRRCHDELRVLTGHPSNVCWGAFSTDGQSLFSSDDRGGFKVWDVAMGTERKVRVPVPGPFSAAAISSDGKTAAVGKRDGTIHLWDLASGKVRAAHKGHEGAVFSLLFNPRGDRLATGGADHFARVWDVPRLAELLCLRGHQGDVTVAGFSADGKLLATRASDGILKVWDAQTGQQRASFTGQDGAWVLGLAFSADSKTWATAEAHPAHPQLPGRVKLWEAHSGQVQAALEVPHGGAWALAFSPDGRSLAIGGGNGVVRIWDSVLHHLQRTLLGHSKRLHMVAFAPAGNLLATAGNDRTVRVWDLAALPAAATLGGNEHSPGLPDRAPVFSPDGRTLATIGRTSGVRLWDAATGRLKAAWQGPPGWCGPLAFSPDGKLLVSGVEGTSIRLWDLAQGCERAILRGHEGTIRAAAFSPDGKTLATGANDSTVRLWDISRGRQLRLLRHTCAVEWLAFTPDGKSLVMAAAGRLRLCELHSGASRDILPGVEHLYHAAIAPDGKLLAAADYGGWAVRLADLATGKALATFKGHAHHVVQVAFAPGGARLVSASEDGTIKLWDLDSHHELYTFPAREGRLGWFAFSPNGKVLAAWGADEKLRLWSADTASRVPRPEWAWHLEQAILCMQERRPPAALFHVRRLLALPLPSQARSGSSEERHDLAAQYLQLAELLSQDETRPEGEKVYQRSVELLQDLAADY